MTKSAGEKSKCDRLKEGITLVDLTRYYIFIYAPLKAKKKKKKQLIQDLITIKQIEI